MRTKNSFYNMLSAFVGQGVGILSQLIARIVFLRYLDATYLGLFSLFSNLLSVLSLIELGAGTAMTYSLYKPLAEKNTALIKSLMNLYRKIYTVIGGSIIVLGVVVTPVYPHFIDELPNISNLTLIYWIFVLNTAITYFFSYKRILVICDQKRYIYSLCHYGAFALISLVQSVVLVMTQNFILYLLCITILTIAENITMTKIADRLYPYLKEKNIELLPAAEIKEIHRNITSMMMHKIGGTVVSSTDNIIIAKFLGLTTAGLYSNYLLIVDALQKIIMQIFHAITASVGNLIIEDDKNHICKVFYRTFFMNAWIIGFCTICLVMLFQPFIQIYAGTAYLLDDRTVFLVCLNFYLSGMRKTVLSFRDASATYYYDRYKAVIEAILNLIISIILAWKIGLPGVFLGTTISTLAVSFWIEPLILYRHVLHSPVREYFKRLLFCTVTTFFAGIITLLCCRCIEGTIVVKLLIRCCFCLVVPNTIFLIAYFKTSELRYFIKLGKQILIKLYIK